MAPETSRAPLRCALSGLGLGLALALAPLPSHGSKAAPHASARPVALVNKPVARQHARARRPPLLATLTSSAVLIVERRSGATLFAKNARTVMPIASVTKLMTALVVLAGRQDLNAMLQVSDADVDRLKYSTSRLRVGTRLSRRDMLHIALMSSENRAASALGRHYPGGRAAFVAAMNAKARSLGMVHSHFVEPTGLSSANVSTPADLVKLVVAAQAQPLIRRYSTDPQHAVRQGRHATVYRNSNRLIASSRWTIGVQKTGYIAEAGRCMVLHARIRGRDVVMVFLDAHGKFARARDANQVRTWLSRQALPARP